MRDGVDSQRDRDRVRTAHHHPEAAEAVGGGATAPTPGWLLRAARASCGATLVAMEAARDGVELTDLTGRLTRRPARSSSARRARHSPGIASGSASA